MTTSEERVKAAQAAFAYMRICAASRPYQLADANRDLAAALWDAAPDLFAAVDERDALRARIAERERAHCTCEKCLLERFPYPLVMSVCPECGDKRCPRAADHRNECNRKAGDLSP